MKNSLKRILSILLAVTIILGSAVVGFGELDFREFFSVKAEAASESGMVEFDGHYYEVFEDALSWTNAKTKCEELGGHLVTITSAEENDFVEKIISGDSGRISYWIGLIEDELTETLRWVTSEPVSYTNWDEGEPNDAQRKELYTHIYSERYPNQPSGKWNDTLITGINIEEQGFICEWDAVHQIKSDYTVLSYSDLKNIDNSTVVYDNPTLSITATDYYSVNISDCTLTESAVMVFGAIPTNTNSHISAVHCNGYDAIVEAENVKFPISGQISDDEKTININAYTDLSDFSEFQLLQNGSVLQTSTTGSFSLLAKTIPVGSSLEVRVVGSDGKKYPKIETNIKTYEAKTDFSVQGSKISITLPEDIFIVGGAEFELDLEDLPVFIMRSDDSIKVGIGASETSEYIKNGETENSKLWGDWKHLVDDLKNDYTDGKIDYKAYKCMHDLNMGKFFSSTGFVPQGSAKICAYAEFRFVDGEWIAIGGNGCLAVSISVSNEWQTFVWAVPVVIKLEGSVGANADFSVGFDFDEGRWYVDSDFEFTLPEIRGSVGVGIARVFDGSAYLKLKNTVNVSFKNEYVNCVLNGELGLSGKFLCFSGEKSLWNFLDWQYYYNSWADSTALSYPDNHNSPFNPDSIYDKNTYSIDTREHLENQSEWYGAYNYSTFSLNLPEKYSEKLLQESVYEAVNPKTVTTSNGTTIMVWTTDIAERSSGNHTAVVYSVYDNDLGVWSEPQIVCDDGTADSYPDVTAYGNNIYVTWVNVNEQFDETVTVEQMSEACEISVACYNFETASFTKLADLTNDTYFNYLPVVTAVDDVVYVGYAENTGNNPFTQDGENSLYLATVNADGSYTTERVITSINPVTGLDIGFLENNINLAFLMDTDSDITTSDDIELFIYDNNKQIAQVTDNNISEQSVQFSKINGVSSVSYYSSDNVYYFNDISNINSVSTSGNSVFSPEYKFIDDENGTVIISKAISVTDGATNIYASIYSEDCWLNPIKVTDSEIDIKSFDVYNTADKGIGVVYSKSQIEAGELIEEEEGKYKGTYKETVDLYSTSFVRYSDISFNGVSVNEKVLNEDGNVSVTINVTNNGLITLDSFTLDVKSNDVDVYQTTIENLGLLPGETREIDVYISFGAIENLKAYNFIINTDETSDIDSTNNEQQIDIGYVDLDLSLDRTVSNGNTSCVAVIKNNSCISSGMEMVIRKNSYDGDILQRIKLPEISGFEETKYYITPDFISDNFDSGDAVCIEIISAKEEKVLGNNYQFLTVSKSEIETFEYTILENNCIEITKYNGGDSVVVIPETFDDYTVTSIASNIISSDITSITLPSTIESVDVKAFNSATSLTEIIVDDENVSYNDVNGILYSADKTQLVRCPVAYEQNVVLESGVFLIADYAFNNCAGVVSIDIPQTVSSIGAYAFAGCSGILCLEMQNGVQTIGNYAFDGCCGITDLVIPNTVTGIGNYAFRNCSFKEITIPENVTSIGLGVFKDCDQLKTVNYNAVACEKMGGTGTISFIININRVFYGVDLETLNIGGNVESIPANAFYNADIDVINITENSKLTEIGNYAFYSNDITSLNLPKTVTNIGNYAFSNCSNLKKMIIHENVVSIGTKTFNNSGNLTVYCYPNSVAHTYAVDNSIPYVLYQILGVGDTTIDTDNKFIFTDIYESHALADFLTVSGYTAEIASATEDAKLYGTASTIDVYWEGELDSTYKLIVIGDTNGDSVCDTLDAAQTELIANGHKGSTIEQIYAANGCVSDEIDVVSYQTVVNTALAS